VKRERKGIAEKTGDFDPSNFVDHYEAALVELLRQKQAGISKQGSTKPGGSNRRTGDVRVARQTASTPTGFVGAGLAEKLLNVCLHQVESNIPVKLLAPLV
jgi:hypothetical protein